MDYIGWIRYGWTRWKPVCSSPMECVAWDYLHTFPREDPDLDDERVVLPRGMVPTESGPRVEP